MTFKHVISIVLFFVNSNIFASLTCSNPKTECMEARGTRHFDGAAVTLDCWRYKTVYECREKSDNNCQQLREQGCSQINAKCRSLVAGTCVVQDETFKCPVEQCDETGDIVCAKNIFCIGGDCSPTITTKNSNFDKAASALAVLSEAAKQVKEQNIENPIIFAGKPMECSRNILSGITKDCCADNEGIFSCAEDEKELYQMRKAGRAIEIGEYCYNEKLGVCTSHHKAYCVFGSKIARIVQNDGRKNQLGISLGDVGDDYAHLNCRGIAKEELSKMNFNLMDFSELYDGIRKETEKRVPKKENLERKASGYTYEELKEKSANGNVMLPETSAGLKASERVKEFYDKRIKK